MGLEVELACRSTSPEAQQRLDSLRTVRHEVAFSRSPLHPGNARALGQMRGVLRRGRYDVVDVHTAVAGWITRLAVRLSSPRTIVIYTAHGFHFHAGGRSLRNLALLTAEKWAGKWTDYLVVVNREDEAAAKRYNIVALDRVRYMAGEGIDTTQFDPARVAERDILQTRQELRLDEDDVLFLMIGEYTARKRHADAVRALALLADPKIHLAFAGTGRLMAQTQAMANDLGLKEHTHFLGYRTDIPRLIRASRATILPSSAEGVPACVRESLALEVPVIGTRVRGTHELLEDGCGILVPLGDIHALAEAMRWMVEHPAEALAMGQRGRRKMLGRYELEQVLQQTEALYREALHLNGDPFTPLEGGF